MEGRKFDLEQENADLRNEILELAIVEGKIPICRKEEKEINKRLKLENKRMKELLDKNEKEKALKMEQNKLNLNENRNKAANESTKRNDIFVGLFNHNGEKESKEKLEFYNKELKKVRDSIKISLSEYKGDKETQIKEIKKTLEEGNKVLSSKHRPHVHVHHHSHKSAKKTHENLMKHHHFKEYKEYTSSDSGFDESPIISKIRALKSKPYQSPNCLFCVITDKKEPIVTKKEEISPKSSPKPKRRQQTSQSIAKRGIVGSPTLKKYDEIQGWQYIDKTEFCYWESISPLASDDSLPEYIIPPKNLKPSYPFTEKTPRKLPWDTEEKEVPETRPNRDQGYNKLTFSKCESIIIESITANKGKQSSARLTKKVKLGTKEFDYIRFWVSCACGKVVTFNEVLKANNVSKFNAMMKQSKNIPTLVLMKTDNYSNALNTAIKDNSVFTRERVCKGSYVLCAADLGRIAVNRHCKCYPSKELMEKLTNQGFNSVVYKNNSAEFICIADGTKVIPLYSFAIL